WLNRSGFVTGSGWHSQIASNRQPPSRLKMVTVGVAIRGESTFPPQAGKSAGSPSESKMARGREGREGTCHRPPRRAVACSATDRTALADFGPVCAVGSIAMHDVYIRVRERPGNVSVIDAQPNLGKEEVAASFADKRIRELSRVRASSGRRWRGRLHF